MSAEAMPTFEELEARCAALERASAENATRFEAIKTALGRLVVAISGDPENDILGLVGRLKLIDAQLADLQRRMAASEIETSALKATSARCTQMCQEWQDTKAQAKGAKKVGGVLWAFIGAGGLAVLSKLYEAFSK